MITLLNTSIITGFGQFDYSPSELSEVKNLLAESAFQSAIGHQATADILSDLLGRPVPVNRINYAQQPGDVAIVFKLRGRAPEGAILDRAQVEEMGYDFGILRKLS